jgi:hypothetical protein
MSFFKRLVPLKADISMNLQSLTVENGQPFKGTASLNSRDNFHVEGVRMEIRVTESWQEPGLERDSNGNERQVMKNMKSTLFSQDVPVSQQFDMGNGDHKDFPFEVTIPMRSSARYGGSIAYSLKAVVNVKGRPDVTKEAQPMVVPATFVPGGVAAAVPQKEVIRVPCEYCGTMLEITSGITKCPSCYGPITSVSH